MRWTPGGRSRNVDDLRGRTGGGGFGGGFGGRGMGIGGVVIALILSLVFGVNIFDGGGGGGAPTTQVAPGQVDQPVSTTPEEERLVEFVSFVLDDAQTTWARLFPRYFNTQYQDARLALFRDGVNSACGAAPAAVGPFYCPADQRIYIDLAFYNDLARRFGAPGDFAQAYVLAHEIGHHVQHVLGIEQRVRQMQETRPGAANQLSVLLELQADCFAGIWGNSTAQRQILEQGDIEEGLRAASAVGDDSIQRMTTGSVRQESFTHGSAEQRSNWFRRGLESGDPNTCDTFGSVGRG